MAILQAFVDDSSSDLGSKRLFLAGYIQREDVWAAFFDEWRYALQQHPPIEYFKMSEANALRGQFERWSKADRDAKVLRLAKLVQKHHLHFVCCSVSRKEYSEILGPAAPEGLKNPYFACFWGVINTVARYHQATGQDIPPVDFIFDEQGGLGDDAAMFYRWQKEDADPDIRRFLGSTPVFGNDKNFPQLQAADLLAWHLRKRHEDGGLPNKAVFDLLTEQGATVELDAKLLRSLAQKMRRVPGVKLIQNKSQWKATKRNIREQLAAGAEPPRTGLVWMHYIALRASLERAWGRWRRIRQKLIRR